MGNALADDRLSSAGRALHDLGAAALFGGNLFARVGMHPALADISAPRERGRVVNHAWRRYGTVNSVSLLAVLAGWTLARRDEASNRMLSASERRLAQAKDIAAGAVAVSGLASALGGVLFARMEPRGAIALADGASPTAETPAREARAKRIVSALGAAELVSSGALVTVNAALAQVGFVGRRYGGCSVEATSGCHARTYRATRSRTGESAAGGAPRRDEGACRGAGEAA